MCLVKVYTCKADADETFVMDAVTQIKTMNQEIMLTNLLGETLKVNGKIKSVDLEKNIARIEKFE